MEVSRMIWMEKMKKLSLPLAVASKLAALLAIWGAITQSDLWLAPTQWLLVAILLAVWAVYGK